jgi:hypothetical protein
MRWGAKIVLAGVLADRSFGPMGTFAWALVALASAIVAALSWRGPRVGAWAIVAEELEKPNVARETIINAVAAAHACAVAASNRSLSNARSQSRQKVSKAAASISTCVRDTRAVLRHALDDAAQRKFLGEHVDSEVMDGFLDDCRNVALKFFDVPYAVRILNELGWTENQDDVSRPYALQLLNEIEAMHSLDRRVVEDGLRLMADQPSNVSALKVFSTIAGSLEAPSAAEFREYAGDLNITYVSDVAGIWRRSGLRPARSHLVENPDHRSWFHHFVELVLRDHLDLDPRRPGAVPENRYEWLISDEDLKTVISADSEKRP